MSTNRTTHVGPEIQNGGFVWNKLHSEREDICDALVGGSAAVANMTYGNEREWMEGRLRQLDDALDRLMAGSYGICSKCGRWIEDNRLDTDPALAFCVECQHQTENKTGLQM
jgi:RNA polymerase-binding transcription factor DksA